MYGLERSKINKAHHISYRHTIFMAIGKNIIQGKMYDASFNWDTLSFFNPNSCTIWGGMGLYLFILTLMGETSRTQYCRKEVAAQVNVRLPS